MAKDDRPEAVELTLRFNEPLRQQLAEAAKDSLRSMNSEIIYRLKTSFERKSGEAA